MNPSPMVKTNDPGIYKRGDRYVVVYYVNGRQKKETTGSLKAARQLKRRRQVEADEGRHVEASKQPYAKYATEWIDRYHGKPGKEFRDSTRQDYKRDLRFSIEFFGPAMQLGQITPHDIARFVDWLNDPAKQGKQFAPSTLRNKVAPMAACLGTAFAERLIPTNPALGVNYPGKAITATIDSGDLDGEGEGASKALTREQLSMFLELSPEKYRLLLEFAAATGLRVAELKALQWRHLDLEGDNGPPVVKVRRQVYRGKVQPPKSRHGKRDVPLTFELADALRRWRDASLYSKENDLVFPGEGGKPFSDSNIASKVIKPIAAEAGVSQFSWHGLRHTCASMLFADGRNIKQVQRWLGHHSPDFTLRTYVHLMDEGVGEGLAIPMPGAGKVATKVAMHQSETAGIPVVK